MERYILPVAAIVAVTTIAVINGVYWKLDGALTTAVVSVIAGLGGYAWAQRHGNQH